MSNAEENSGKENPANGYNGFIVALVFGPFFIMVAVQVFLVFSAYQDREARRLAIQATDSQAAQFCQTQVKAKPICSTSD